jgi:Zn-dependent M16 (insulinase) family peptidase
MVSGMPCFRLVEKLTADYDNNKEELKSKLTELIKCIFRPENLMVDITSTNEGYEASKDLIPLMKEKLFTDDIKKESFSLVTTKKNEAYSTSAQIQYVCRAGNFMTNTDYKYTGALRVLKVILGYDYLWINVRVKGGAYGCMCNFGKTGDSYLVSYRDPNLKKTVEVFEKTGDYVRSFDADERTMTKYIIGAIGDMDVPMTPAVKGSRSSGAYLSNLDFADVQKERDELLNCTKEDIQALAGYIDAIINEDAVCVVGNSQSIEENKDMFMSVENLFH